MLTETSDDWPTFAQELERKALQNLQKWIERNDRGECTDRDLFIVADVTFDLISGLTSRDVMDQVQLVRKEILASAKETKKAKT